MSKSNRILDFSLEFSPLQPVSTQFGPNPGGSKDFWDQYFTVQEIAQSVAENDGRLVVEVVNNETGEKMEFRDLRLKTESERDIH